MALALYEYFKHHGSEPTLRVQMGFVHAYAEVNGIYYDYTGASPDKGFPALTPEDFFKVAAEHGYDEDEVRHDATIAADLIAECKSIPLEEDYLKGDCSVYAVALAERGWQPVGLYDEVWDTVPKHVGAVNSEGLYADARGHALSREEFVDGWGDVEIKPISVDEIKRIFARDYRVDPLQEAVDIHSLLKRFDTHDDYENGTMGYCGTFALALYRYLKKKGDDAHLYHSGYYENGEWDWTHFFVKSNGKFWDVTGEIFPNDARFREWYDAEEIKEISEEDAIKLMNQRSRAYNSKYYRSWSSRLDEGEGMTLVLWHGGRNLQSDYQEIRAHKNGRWEHGPGIYLTDHRDTAAKYAKGGGSVFRVTITFDPTKGLDDVAIDIDDAIEFIKRNAIARLRSQIIADLRNSFDRRGVLRASVVVNLCLNWDALAPAKTEALRRFLIDQGVEYTKVDRFGGRDETLYVVVNPKIIQKVEVIRANEALEEGLINFPQGMFDTAMRIIAREVLSWAATVGPVDDMGRHELKSLANRFGCTVSTDYPAIEDKPLRAFGMKLEDLPGYPAPEKEKMIVAVNWTKGLNTNGQWFNKHSALIVSPFSSRILNGWPNNAYALSDCLDDLETTVRHELRHAIQFMYLTDHPEQSKSFYKKSSDTKEYYSSPVEYDPTIGSEVDSFMIYYRTLDGYGNRPSSKKLSQMIKQVTGMSRGTVELPTSPFFKILKQEAPVRYKRAVKKFTYEVMKDVEEWLTMYPPLRKDT